MAPLASGGHLHHGGAAQTQEPQRGVDSGVSLLAGQHADGGAPTSPSSSTSQPARASTRCRPAARPTVLAACPPVTSPNDAGSGRPSRSFSQTPAASSAMAAAGEEVLLNAF